MEPYIKKADIVAEIERRRDFIYKKNPLLINSKYCIEEDNEILDFINTLEVKEEVLDKEGKTKLMKKCVHKAYKRGYDMGVFQTTNKIKHNTKKVDLEKEFDNYAKDILACDVQFEPFTHLHKCAKYFFELGMATRNKAQKGE